MCRFRPIWNIREWKKQKQQHGNKFSKCYEVMTDDLDAVITKFRAMLRTFLLMPGRWKNT